MSSDSESKERQACLPHKSSLVKEKIPVISAIRTKYLLFWWRALIPRRPLSSHAGSQKAQDVIPLGKTPL